MKKLIILIGMLLLTGCGPYVEFQPPTGLLFTNVTAPLTLNVDDTKTVHREGKAKSYNVDYRGIGLTVGDNSLERALDRGLLRRAAYADYELLRVLGVFERWSVNVYGLK